MGLTRRYKEAVQRLYSRPHPIPYLSIAHFLNASHLATSALVCLSQRLGWRASLR